MSTLFQDIKRNVRQLDPQEKLQLVQELIDELDRDPELDLGDDWVEMDETEPRTLHLRGL